MDSNISHKRNVKPMPFIYLYSNVFSLEEEHMILLGCKYTFQALLNGKELCTDLGNIIQVASDLEREIARH